MAQTKKQRTEPSGLVNSMEQEEPCEAVKETASIIEPPKTPNPNVPDSVPATIDSDSSLSEEEIIIATQSDVGVESMKIDSSSISDFVLVSDEEIVESIYQSLLSIIFSLQSQSVAAVSVSVSVSASASGAEVWCFDGCKTPPPSSRSLDSKMVDDTCPGAPMKLTKISRNIDSGLRRKLF